MHRRKFLQMGANTLLGATLAATPLAGPARVAASPGPRLPGLQLFSKVLQFLDYGEMAEAAADLGFRGLDLTVRPGGHVEPDDFERDLPLAVRAIRDAGLTCDMMVTSITGTQHPRDRDLLALARSLGIRRYRTGGLRYDKHIHAMKSVDRYREQLSALAGWNRDIGITGMFQNHSGERRLGAAVWDLYLILKDLDPEFLGCQFDVRHATTDGGLMWPDSFRLMRPFIRSIVFKDFRWGRSDDGWRLINTPIGEGMVEFKRYFGMLKDGEMHYPVSVHCEYELGGAEKGRRDPTMPKSDILAAIGNDVVTIRQLWNES